MIDFGAWLPFKRELVEITTLERDALHIYAGIGIQLVFAGILQWRLREWRTLIPILAIEIANETADLVYETWPSVDRWLQWSAAAHDLLNTIAVPIIIILIARRISVRPG